MTKYDRYIDGVLSGEVVAGEYAILSVKRHKNDLKRKEFYFDTKAADSAIRMIESMNLTEGPMILSDFQAFIVSQIFGWKQAKDGYRRYRYSYLEMARKSGKTTLVEAIALIFFLSDPKAEIYNAATKRDQAKYGFQIAQDIVKHTPLLEKQIKVYQHTMLAGSSRFEPLSAEAKRLDGLNPLVNIIDEYHEHPSDKLYNVLKSGMGARKQPHQMVITTAGFNKGSACFNLRKTCIEILRGVKQDDSMFVMIFTLDEDDDWENPENWQKANPNLDITVSMDFLIQEYKQAKNNGGSEEVNFKTKNLNIWCDAAKTWIPDAVWVKNHDARFKPADLLGKRCYGGLDCAKSVDLNSFVLFFPEVFEKDGKAISAFLPYFWIPEEYVKNNRDRVDYSRWVQQGHIYATEGNIADFKQIEFDILRLITDYDFGGLSYDPAYAGNVASNLASEGIQVSPLRQGFLSLTMPTNELERLAVGEMLEHFDNPVMRWMIGNVELAYDPAGNIKPDKSKSGNKIDGPAALIDAIAHYKTNGDQSFNIGII